jgi:hypothetical protein
MERGMSPPATCWMILLVGAMTCAIVGDSSPATGQTQPSAASRDAEAKERAARREEMRLLAAKLSFEEPGATPVVRHLVVEKPLLHFTDADRGIFDGTLWAYGREGRPVAVVEMYCGRGTKVLYRHATTGTCDRPLKLAGAAPIEWRPQVSAIAWGDLKADDPPATEASTRLRQMKALAKRFSAYQVFEPTMQREELRLLVQPLYCYSDAREKVQDGVIFAMALGTNPEALLFIEAREHAEGVAAWHYGYARRGSSAAVHGFLDGEEVWSVPRLLKVKPEDPHIHFLRTPNGVPVLDAPS